MAFKDMRDRLLHYIQGVNGPAGRVQHDDGVAFISMIAPAVEEGWVDITFQLEDDYQIFMCVPYYDIGRYFPLAQMQKWPTMPFQV